MRILAFSGTHENLGVADAFIRRIERMDSVPDLFLSAGDLGPRCSTRIFRHISRFGKPMFYVLGNHSLHYPASVVQKASEEIISLGAVPIQQRTYETAGLNFVGQDAWTDFTDDERDPQRYQDLKKRTSCIEGASTILITHHAPLGLLDSGFSYPLHAYHDERGLAHAGSLALRLFSEQFKPRVHIFAHCHSDGGRHLVLGETLYANVCHLERRTKDGRYCVTGSFAIIDTDTGGVMAVQLGATQLSACWSCGAQHYSLYRQCVNCTKGSRDVITADRLP